MKHYKFLHVLWRSPKIFAPRIINLIIDPKNGFNVDDHLFVTTHKELYDHYHDLTENIIFADGYNFKKGSKLINDYASTCDWLFVHCMCLPTQFIHVKNKYLKKIIWRAWGGDTGFTYYDHQIIKNIIKWIINKTLKSKYLKIHTVGVAGTTDIIDLREKFGEFKTVIIPYPNDNQQADNIVTAKMLSRNDFHKGKRIMIGHSGYEVENHIDILNRLLKYQNNNIMIYLNFTYGDGTYIKKVVNIAKSMFKDKVIVLNKFIQFDEYCKLISSMDIGIFDAKSSNGLGNISLFKAFEKTIYINGNGVIRKAFDIDKVPYRTTDLIGKISYNEFAEPIKYPDLFYESYIKNASYDCKVEQWKSLLKSLSNEKT